MFKIRVERGSFIHPGDSDLERYFRSWNLNPLKGGYQYDLGWFTKFNSNIILDAAETHTEAEFNMEVVTSDIKAGNRFIGISVNFETTAVDSGHEEYVLIKMIQELFKRAKYSLVNSDLVKAQVYTGHVPIWVDSVMLQNTFIIKVSDEEAEQLNKLSDIDIVKRYSWTYRWAKTGS